MSRRVGTPVNQKRLTNVSVVKLMKNGKRFEIACYCNKVESWRKGVETDMTEVLQSEFVFTNVSKGEFASSKDLKKAFDTDDVLAVCQIILADGEIQLTAKERQAHKESTFRDIATIISEKCINPTNSRPYTVSTILSALKDDLKYGLVPGRSAKQQALDLIKRLSVVIPIARARMHVRVHDAPPDEEQKTALVESLKYLEVRRSGETLDYFIEPDVFNEFSARVAKFNGRVEVVQLSVEPDVADSAEPSPPPPPRNERQAESVQSLESEEGDPTDKSNSKRKSKGAKRREKEEAIEKAQARQAAKAKQEERENKVSETAEAVSAMTMTVAAPAESSGETKSCTTCGGSFKTAAEHRAHFKTNWHRFNLKLKLANQPTVSEAEFNAVDAEDFF